MAKKTKEPKSGNSLAPVYCLRIILNITKKDYITNCLYNSTPIYWISSNKEVL